MSEKTFEIKGKFLSAKTENKFQKVVKAVNENFAKEKIVSKLGSDHKLKRHNIIIEDLKEINV